MFKAIGRKKALVGLTLVFACSSTYVGWLWHREISREPDFSFAEEDTRSYSLLPKSVAEARHFRVIGLSGKEAVRQIISSAEKFGLLELVDQELEGSSGQHFEFLCYVGDRGQTLYIYPYGEGPDRIPTFEYTSELSGLRTHIEPFYFHYVLRWHATENPSRTITADGMTWQSPAYTTLTKD